MNKKIFATLGTTALYAFTTAVFSAVPTFATGNSYIALKYHEIGQNPTTCYIYREQGYNTSYPQCSPSYGSFDTATNTLTPGTAINSMPNTRITLNFDSPTTVSVTANSDINTNFYSVSQDTNVVLDFSSHTYKETYYQYSANSSKEDNDFGMLTIKSGTLTLHQINTRSTTQILGGDITLASDPIIAISTEGFSMSGGSITSPSSGIFLHSSGDINISGGEIVAENIETTGISLAAGDCSFTMSDGNISLKSANEPAGFGIRNKNQNYNTTINGGTLTIDGFEWGISGENNKLIFNGGTTKITNSAYHTIWISPALDPENDIVFGTNMGIKENTYVFWTDDGFSPSTGIADPNTVTITSGYTYRRHYGWESIDSDDSSIPSVPDTGIFGMDEKTTAIVGMIAALPVFATIGYAIRFLVKRNQKRVKF